MKDLFIQFKDWYVSNIDNPIFMLLSVIIMDLVFFTILFTVMNFIIDRREEKYLRWLYYNEDY